MLPMLGVATVTGEGNRFLWPSGSDDRSQLTPLEAAGVTTLSSPVANPCTRRTLISCQITVAARHSAKRKWHADEHFYLPLHVHGCVAASNRQALEIAAKSTALLLWTTLQTL